MTRQANAVTEPAKNGARHVDIHRSSLHLRGTIYDINRVMQACKMRLAILEQQDCDPAQTYSVYVRPPQSDEP